MIQMPIITLSTGLRVGNLNIPYSLKFVDDNVIASCGPDQAKAGRPKLWEHLTDETTLAEVREARGTKEAVGSRSKTIIMYQDVVHEYRITTEAARLLHFAHTEPVDIILVTTELLEAVRCHRKVGQAHENWSKVRSPVTFLATATPPSVFWPTDEAPQRKVNIDKFRY